MLEDRICLAFTWSHDPNTSTLILTGTNSDDDLYDIRINASGNVRYETDTLGTVDTTIPAPTAANPLWISISGLNGNDDVVRTFLTGFPHDSVANLTFVGGAGNDRFFPPKWHILPSGLVWSPIVWAEGPHIVNIVFQGQAGEDELHGENYAEYFDGGDDRDKAWGHQGNDALIGGLSTDILDGQDGDDLIKGMWGGDDLMGGPGEDTIEGGDDPDIIKGGPDDDTISGGTYGDSIEGNDGKDNISGNEGNDSIKGGRGNDTIFTGTSDTVPMEYEDFEAPGGPWFEIVWGGPNDGFDFGDWDIIDALSASGSAYLDGGDDHDIILGSDFGDLILGGSGPDIMSGCGGPDSMWGGAGDDVLWSNLSGAPDQPYGGGPSPNPTWPDMMGTGEAHCNYVDDIREGDCPPSEGGGGGPSGGGGGGSGFGGAMMSPGSEAGLAAVSTEDCGCGSKTATQASASDQGGGKSKKLAEFLASRRLLELMPSGEWRAVRPVGTGIATSADLAVRPVRRLPTELLLAVGRPVAAKESPGLRTTLQNAADEGEELVLALGDGEQL